MSGHQPIILEDRHRDVRGTHPQCLTDECKRRRIQHVIEFDVAIPMQLQAKPFAQIRGNIGQPTHQRLLDEKALQWLLSGGAMNANTGFFQHPAMSLLVQVGHIAEGTGR